MLILSFSSLSLLCDNTEVSHHTSVDIDSSRSSEFLRCCVDGAGCKPPPDTLMPLKALSDKLLILVSRPLSPGCVVEDECGFVEEPLRVTLQHPRSTDCGITKTA